MKLVTSLCLAASLAANAAAPFVFEGPTVTNVAGCDGWRETAMTDIVVRAGSALDLSGLSDCSPAGAKGWAKPWPDGSLRFEGDAGRKARLYGCVCGSIDFKRMLAGSRTSEERRARIDAFVSQTRRMGFNFIRPHGMLDAGFDISRYRSRGRLAPEDVDEMDYLLHACRKAGIYVYADIGAYGLRDPKERNQILKKAGVMVKEPEYWALWENCCREILEHVNPYTGVAWKDDPAVMGLMLYNEQATGARIAIQSAWKVLEPGVRAAYVEGFKAWLAQNAPDVPADGIDASADSLPGFYGGDVRGRLLHRYLSGLFSARAADYGAVARSTGYAGLLTSYNSDVDFGACAARWLASEAVPYNFHAGHPSGGGSGYAGAKVSQRSTIESMAAGSGFCYGNRIRLADRPFIVTENSHAFWNRRRYECALMLPAYGALNGYAGILWHAGGGDPMAIGEWPRGGITVFKISTSPVMRAATFLGALLFRRGDVAEAGRNVNIAVTERYWLENSAEAPSTTQARLGLLLKCGLVFPERGRPASVTAPFKADVTVIPGSGDEVEDGLWVSKVRGRESRNFDLDEFVSRLKSRGILPEGNLTSPRDGIYQSETGEITLHGRECDLTVVTPRTEAVCTPAGRTRRLDVFTLDSSSEDCCAALASIDGEPLSKSRRMVFLWITQESNSGMVTSADGKTMVRMGGYPALLKGGRVSFRARVSAPAGFRMYLLDYSGARLEEVPLCVEDGDLACSLDTASLVHGPTPFFELVADGSTSARGATYRFSANGGDVIGRVNALDLKPGDKVLFKRGELFRGAIQGRGGVTYGAWGEGPRPTICASRRDYADPSLWRPTGETNVWRCTERLHNVGIVLFDHDPQVLGAYDRKFALMRLPSRNEPFDKPVALDADLTFRNLFHEDRVELRSDLGNPGARFRHIEMGEHGHCLWLKGDGITVEDLHLTLSGSHGVGGSGMRKDTTVHNYVIDWLGGSIIEGWKFGTARFGNGVEIWGGCDGFRVHDNWIYQIYDTGVTIQCNDRSDFVCRMVNVEFVSNRIENCFWALEYYNRNNAPGSFTRNVLFKGNVCLRTGRGWGCAGREHLSPVLALGETPADTGNFTVEGNVFEGSTGPIVARRGACREGVFRFRGNTYRQFPGGKLESDWGVFTSAEMSAEPTSPDYTNKFVNTPFDASAADYLARRYGDVSARVETLGLRKGERVLILGDSLTNQGR